MLNTKAVGILFANMHDASVGEMTEHRSMASLPFGGRYRLIDFALSSFTDAGITKVGVIAKSNYSSLMDHLGSGRQWDLSRKRGGLSIFPPHRYSDETESLYHGRIQALHNVLSYVRNSIESYVVLMDCDYVCNYDTGSLIASHIESGADVTMLCCGLVPDEEMVRNCIMVRPNDEGRAIEMLVNHAADGSLMSMNVFVIAKDILIGLIENAIMNKLWFFERDILVEQLDELDIRVFRHEGFVRRIYSMKSYFDANMSLLEYDNLTALFLPERPIYTKVRDEAPVRYGLRASVHNTLLADGCIVEGTVSDSVLFRGVKVEKGAVVKDSILMQDTIVREGAVLSHVITDKNVRIFGHGELAGETGRPLYIKKASVV